MKISKLFHWLYGILMLLPILVFIPNAFYYGFNEQAVAQEKIVQQPIYYDTNEVTNFNSLQIGNIYKWNDSWVNNYGYSSQDYFLIDNDLAKQQLSITKEVSYIRFCLSGSGQNNAYLYIHYEDNTYNFLAISNKIFDFIILSFLTNDIPQELINCISSTNYLYVKTYQEVEYSMSITDSMSYAWDSVWQNDLFSWSYESFLAEPFKYIGNVFGLPNDNSIYYCLSYWLDISIIWLCFDLIMYVPLLVHRWIDKGVLE